MDTLVMAAKDRQYVEPGTMVARYREAQAVTQEELAKRVGITTSMVSKIEQGLTKPGVANAHALDEALGTEGHVIFQAYYGPAYEDELSTLRDVVAQLAQDFDDLRAAVAQLQKRP